jgi:excisionase family DNA binding protein
MTNVQPVVFTIAQAAAYLSVSESTIKRMIRTGVITHTRINKSIRLRRQDLDDYVNANLSRELKRVDGRGGRRRLA